MAEILESVRSEHGAVAESTLSSNQEGVKAVAEAFGYSAGELTAVPAKSNMGLLKVIFACVHNAGRSQMAAAFFNRLADPARAEAVSAGTEPGERVHPEVLAVMQEIGIDLSHAKPQKLTEELAQDAQLLITMGCGDKCPYVPGLRRADWPLRDPKGLPIEEVRAIRDQVKSRVRELIDSEDALNGLARC